MSGGMRKRHTPFVQIDSKSVNNPDLSLRSIGLLAWLLDKPEGWDVRSEAITKKTKEGRAAIRTALHELAAVGHYRIERRRLRNGKFEMGTAVSYYPDPDWAAQYAEFDGKPVTMIEQQDGSFKVKHKDGTLADDGFEEDVFAGQTEDQKPDSGFPVAGEPDFGEPDSEDPESGRPSAINRTHTEDRETEPTSSTSDEVAPDSEQPTLISVTGGASSTRATDGQQPEVPTAETIAKGWWDYYQANYGQITRVGTGSPFVALRDKIIQPALDGDWTPDEIKWALMRPATGDGIPDAVPDKQRFQRALAAVRKGAPAPGQQRAASNVHHMPVNDPDRQARAGAF
jgi:hypothetical protein